MILFAVWLYKRLCQQKWQSMKLMLWDKKELGAVPLQQQNCIFIRESQIFTLKKREVETNQDAKADTEYPYCLRINLVILPTVNLFPLWNSCFRVNIILFLYSSKNDAFPIHGEWMGSITGSSFQPSAVQSPRG